MARKVVPEEATAWMAFGGHRGGGPGGPWHSFRRRDDFRDGFRHEIHVGGVQRGNADASAIHGIDGLLPKPSNRVFREPRVRKESALARDEAEINAGNARLHAFHQ